MGLDRVQRAVKSAAEFFLTRSKEERSCIFLRALAGGELRQLLQSFTA
jgi:hypothetical protein